MPDTRTLLPLGELTVSVREWTPDQHTGSTVLLLHGGGADSAELSWGGVGPALAAQGHRVLAPDHPGFGESRRSRRPVTQERLVAYVGDLVDAMELDDYVIGGLSLGGSLTIGHLLDRPGSARGALLLGAYGLMPRLTDGAWSGLTQAATHLLVRSGMLGAITRRYASNRALLERGLSDLVRDPASRTPELIDAVIDEAQHGTGTAVFGEWQRDQVGWSRLRTDYRDRLPDIDTPTLLIHGTHDTGVPFARAVEAASLMPHARLLPVDGAGHWVQRDRPDVVIPAIADFLGSMGDASTADSE